MGGEEQHDKLTGQGEEGTAASGSSIASVSAFACIGCDFLFLFQALELS